MYIVILQNREQEHTQFIKGNETAKIRHTEAKQSYYTRNYMHGIHVHVHFTTTHVQ